MFISFEGPEGSGKSSQIPLLADYLRAQGYDVLCTREPGGSPIANQIRQIIMSLENKELQPRSELLLFLAARAQSVAEVIQPALQSGKIVLCDRYSDSTLAYQGYGHGLELGTLRMMLDFATGGLQPNFTILLDLDVKTGLLRKKKEDEWNRMDAFAVSFHERVRKGYLELAEQDATRWQIVDAGQSFDTVQNELQCAVLRRITARNN